MLKKNTGFVCGNCKKKNLVNFENMINGDAIKFIQEKEKVLPDLKSKVLKLEVKKKKINQRL